MSNDRPGGMDDAVPKNPTPTQAGSKPNTNMADVAKVAAGKVDSGGRPGYKTLDVPTK